MNLGMVLLVLTAISVASAETLKISLGDSKELSVIYKTSESGSVSIQQFSISGNEKIVSRNDKADLHSFIKGNSTLTPAERKILEFVYSDLPNNERIEDYVAPELRSSHKRDGWTMICHKIGQMHSAEYTDDGDELCLGEREVGKPQSECYGRCGPGCGSRQQYTQECFNHDLCNRVLHSQLGPCSDEFWAAADGFLNAPNCL